MDNSHDLQSNKSSSAFIAEIVNLKRELENLKRSEAKRSAELEALRSWAEHHERVLKEARDRMRELEKQKKDQGG